MSSHRGDRDPTHTDAHGILSAESHADPHSDPHAERDESGTGVERPSTRRTLGGIVKDLLPRLGRAVVAAAVAAVPVGIIAVAVHRNWAPLIDLDNRLVTAATDITREHDTVHSLALWWQEAFVPWKVFALCLVPIVWTYVKGLRGRALWATITLLVGWWLRLQLSLIVQRVRPTISDPVGNALGFSFPSGHAFSAMYAVLVCLILVWPLLERRRALRAALVTGGVVFVALQVLDRVFLGVHYPSDVTAGVLLALALGGASWFGFRRQPGSNAHLSTDDRRASKEHDA